MAIGVPSSANHCASKGCGWGVEPLPPSPQVLAFEATLTGQDVRRLAQGEPTTDVQGVATIPPGRLPTHMAAAACARCIFSGNCERYTADETGKISEKPVDPVGGYPRLRIVR